MSAGTVDAQALVFLAGVATGWLGLCCALARRLRQVDPDLYCRVGGSRIGGVDWLYFRWAALSTRWWQHSDVLVRVLGTFYWVLLAGVPCALVLWIVWFVSVSGTQP